MEASKLVHSYSFQIEVLDITDGSSPENFYEVEGLSISLKTEKYMPGGYNKPFDIPISSQRGDLRFKRPLIEGKTKITQWCEEAVDKLTFKLTRVQILVLNKDAKVVAQWVAEDAYPKGIEITPIGIGSDTLIGESITLSYSRLARVK